MFTLKQLFEVLGMGTVCNITFRSSRGFRIEEMEVSEILEKDWCERFDDYPVDNIYTLSAGSIAIVLDDVGEVVSQLYWEPSEKNQKIKYFVEQKYYDSGKTEARILNEQQAREKGYRDGLFQEFLTFDLYVDVFDTLKKAKKCYTDTLNA